MKNALRKWPDDLFFRPSDQDQECPSEIPKSVECRFDCVVNHFKQIFSSPTPKIRVTVV